MSPDQELLDLHIRALFTHDEMLRLVHVNEPGSNAPAARLCFGRTSTSNLWRFRADLPKTLVEKLEALCVDESVGMNPKRTPGDIQAYVQLLEAHTPVQKIWMGPAFHFIEYVQPSRPVRVLTEASADFLLGGFEELIEELPTWQPFVAVIENGHAVSVCRSVRLTPQAHEAGVETLPGYRGKGYARDAVAAWARLVQQHDALPLYSTSWENVASQALAKKLGLRQYSADFHIT
jgi:RimJ/RimL family protein N-acetyltransferase